MGGEDVRVVMLELCLVGYTCGMNREDSPSQTQPAKAGIIQYGTMVTLFFLFPFRLRFYFVRYKKTENGMNTHLRSPRTAKYCHLCYITYAAQENLLSRWFVIVGLSWTRMTLSAGNFVPGTCMDRCLHPRNMCAQRVWANDLQSGPTAAQPAGPGRPVVLHKTHSLTTGDFLVLKNDYYL